MRTNSPIPRKLPRLHSLAAAVCLALTAGASHAGIAQLGITSFTATPDDPFSKYVYNTEQSQGYTMNTRTGGGVFGSSTVAAPVQNNWSLGLNTTAQSAYALATGNAVDFTDAFTQLLTAGFNLSAQTTLAGHYPSGTAPNTASAVGTQSGAFQLIDGSGTPVAGSITFDLYYELNVSTPEGPLPNDSQASVTLTASDTAGQRANLNDTLNSLDSSGGIGSRSGHFSWTFDLLAGQTARYTLSGNANSSSAVPEPGSLALAALALLGVFAVRCKTLARRGALATATA